MPCLYIVPKCNVYLDVYTQIIILKYIGEREYVMWLVKVDINRK